MHLRQAWCEPVGEGEEAPGLSDDDDEDGDGDDDDGDEWGEPDTSQTTTTGYGGSGG